jgi:aspartyl-tRNA(Asn)/glutamyl-tRNA(Gln) amidotransferase subunit A
MGSTSENCAFQTPRNPWKLGYVAGGSSGGSAVAVAADECFATLGSDTGGSIRQPASLCGTVGMKPTYGRVSRYGLVAFASSLDQVGPLTKDVRDCALMMNAISGYDPCDSTSINLAVPDFTATLQDGLKGIKIGIPAEYFGQGLDPEVDQSVRNGIAMLKEAGAEVVEVNLPHTDYCVAVYYLIAPAEASSNLARFDGVRYGFRDQSADSLIEMYNRSRSQGFGDEVKRRILIGTYALSSGYYDAFYKKASQSVRPRPGKSATRPTIRWPSTFPISSPCRPTSPVFRGCRSPADSALLACRSACSSRQPTSTRRSSCGPPTTLNNVPVWPAKNR